MTGLLEESAIGCSEGQGIRGEAKRTESVQLGEELD